jgi:ubiquinone/menaquinone biosynthesis C-methylase UbiE
MSKLLDYYNQFDEWGRLEREPIEYIVNTHYMSKYLPSEGHILDNGAGPGKYAMHLADQGYTVTLTDLTPRLVQVAETKARELELAHRFQGFHTADATDLSLFPDERFDAALMLGPLYHLQAEEARVKAVQELHRVTKQGGIVFVALMPRIRHLTTSLLFPNAWKPNNSADGLERFLQTGAFDHADEGRFTGAYYFRIEDINPFMEQHGFESLKLIGSSSATAAIKPEQWDYWRDRGDKEYARIMNMVLEAAENPYILGASSHLLYIGKRK